DPAESEDVEVISADDRSPNARGVATLLDQRKGQRLRVLGDRRERLGAGAEIGDFRNREAEVRLAGGGRRLAEVNEPVAVPVREGAKKRPAEQREHRRVGADPERECDDDGRGKASGTPETSERER